MPARADWSQLMTHPERLLYRLELTRFGGHLGSGDLSSYQGSLFVLDG